MMGVRCPACGMTTAWSHCVRGQLVQAVRANTGGTLLALLAMLAAPWTLACAARGRWLVGEPREWLLIGLPVLVLAVTMADWLWRFAANT